jgi:putative restriction endonuclease
MQEVSPGDIVFSFADTRIPAIGVVETYCYERPRPEEFGGAGMNSSNIGWRIRVRFNVLARQIRPKDHMSVWGRTLPSKYSPLQATGNGNQGVYLTEVPEIVGQVLVGLVGSEAVNAARVRAGVVPFSRPVIETADLELWERHIEEPVQDAPDIPHSDRESLIIAR